MSMDNMYKMRAAHKEMKKGGETVHPVTGEEIELGEHDRTLAQIFHKDNKKEQDLFINRFCYEKDPEMAKDIAEALAGETMLTSEQDKFLEKMRGSYNLRRAEVEKVREMLPEEIAHIADTDPRIREVVGKIGPEKAAELLGREFEELAMSDENAFKKVVKNLRDVVEIRTSDIAGQVDRHVQDTLQKYGISEEKYWEATKSGLTADTQENLRKLVAQDFGLFRKSIDFVRKNKLSMKGAKRLYANFEDQNRFLQECDKHLKAVGKVLQSTLTLDVRLAMQKYMLEGGNIKDKKVESNVQTVQDYRQVKAEADPAAIQRSWEQYKKSEISRLKIKDISKQPGALEDMKNRFADNEFKKQNQYRASGVLATLIALLFGTRTKTDIKNSLV